MMSSYFKSRTQEDIVNVILRRWASEIQNRVAEGVKVTL